MSFVLDLSKFTNLTEDKLEKVVKKTFIDLSKGIIKDTPVRSGRAKGNWQFSINKFEDGVLDVEDKTGSKLMQ